MAEREREEKGLVTLTFFKGREGIDLILLDFSITLDMQTHFTIPDWKKNIFFFRSHRIRTINFKMFPFFFSSQIQVEEFKRDLIFFFPVSDRLNII